MHIKNLRGVSEVDLKKSTASPWKRRKTTSSAIFCATGVRGLTSGPLNEISAQFLTYFKPPSFPTNAISPSSKLRIWFVCSIIVLISDEKKYSTPQSVELGTIISELQWRYISKSTLNEKNTSYSEYHWRRYQMQQRIQSRYVACKFEIKNLKSVEVNEKQIYFKI